MKNDRKKAEAFSSKASRAEAEVLHQALISGVDFSSYEIPEGIFVGKNHPNRKYFFGAIAWFRMQKHFQSGTTRSRVNTLNDFSRVGLFTQTIRLYPRKTLMPTS